MQNDVENVDENDDGVSVVVVVVDLLDYYYFYYYFSVMKRKIDLHEKNAFEVNVLQNWRRFHRHSYYYYYF